jgi:hypothetical protein
VESGGSARRPREEDHLFAIELHVEPDGSGGVIRRSRSRTACAGFVTKMLMVMALLGTGSAARGGSSSAVRHRTTEVTVRRDARLGARALEASLWPPSECELPRSPARGVQNPHFTRGQAERDGSHLQERRDADGEESDSSGRRAEDADAEGSANEDIFLSRIDNILLRASDPEPLFTLFAENLGLPVVWPLRSYGPFTSGGVRAGNVNLEIVSFSAPQHSASSGHLYGIAFEPSGSLEQVIRGLDRQELRHSRVMPFRGMRPDGKLGIIWRTVLLPDLQPEDSMVFLCEYAWDTQPKRRALSRQLEQQEGGCLGMIRVEAVTIGAHDLGQATRLWRSYIGKPPVHDGHEWLLGDGPAIRLVEADQDRLLSLQIDVRSFARTRACLAKLGVPHDGNDEMIHATGGVLGEIHLEFREAHPPNAGSDCDQASDREQR